MDYSILCGYKWGNSELVLLKQKSEFQIRSFPYLKAQGGKWMGWGPLATVKGVGYVPMHKMAII